MKRRKLHRLIATVAALAITAGMLGATAPEREDNQAIGYEQEVQEARVAERGFVPAPDLCPEIAELIDIVMHLARNDGRNAELQDIAASFVCERVGDFRTADSVDFRCAESVRQYFGFPVHDGRDERNDLINAFAHMLLAAERQIGRDVAADPILITNYTEITGETVIGFSDEKYFVFIDFIADFTGIDRDEFVAEVTEPMRGAFTHITSDAVVFENEVVNTQPRALPMGTFVNIHWRTPQGANRHMSATLGHPVNVAGTMAMIACHPDFVLRGTSIPTVHLTDGTRIGWIDSSHLAPSLGLSEGRISMENGFTVSRQAEFVNITNFWARLATPTTTAQLRALVEPNYAITTNVAHGVDVTLDMGTQTLRFINLIRISGDFIDQDRGAVLVNQNNNAVGNFIGRIGSFGYFGRTANSIWAP
jgi:hypothetical protein